MAYVEFYNGAKAPALAFGTWQIPSDLAADATYAAIKCGYRHLDLAEIYGNNVAVGQGIKKAFDEGIVKREDLWITSKIWNDSHLPADVKVAVDKLLNDLACVKYLDLILIHWPISFVKGVSPMAYHKDLDLAVVYKALEDYALKEGKAKNLGLSNFSIEETQHILDNCTVKPVCNQVESSIYWKQLELEEFLNKNSMVLTAYSPLCQNIPDPSLNIKTKNLLEDPVLQKIAKKHNTTVAAVAVRWHIDFKMAPNSQRSSRIVLVKSNKPERVVENFETVSALKLDEEDLKDIANIETSYRSLIPMGWRAPNEPFFPNF